MKIAIPSYNRAEKLSKKTYKLLIDNGVPETDIIVFVANEEQKELYKQFLPNTEIIVGVLGMCNIRNFMTDYFDEDAIVCYIDDDIDKFKIKDEKTFLQVLSESQTFLENNNCGIVGFPPTFNEFYNKGKGIRSGNLCCMGGLYVCKNDKNIRVSNPTLEDKERTLLYYDKYGMTARNCDLILRAEIFTDGGVNDADGRDYEKYYQGHSQLFYKYHNYLGFTEKVIPYISKEKIPHFKFRTFKIKPEITPIDVLQLPSIHKTLFDPLLKMLKEIKLAIKVDEETAKSHNGSFRKNFPRHRAEIFGAVKLRAVNGGGYSLSRSSIKRPEIYEELKRIGDIIVPFKYSSILVNNNTICGKHLDASNVGASCIVSIGDYEGCKLNVKGKDYDTKYTPIIIDGAKLEHYTTDDLVGEKYSLVYYYLTDI